MALDVLRVKKVRQQTNFRTETVYTMFTCSLRSPLKVGRLLIYEKNEAQSPYTLLPGEGAGERQPRRDAGGIVGRAGTPKHGVVVPADNDDFIRLIRSRYFNFDIVVSLPSQLILLGIHPPGLSWTLIASLRSQRRLARKDSNVCHRVRT